jgi:hypothetical protein
MADPVDLAVERSRRDDDFSPSADGSLFDRYEE